MAYVYRKRSPEDGDIADPRDLMENISSLIGEFNGGLDADNIPEKSIDHDQVLIGAFVALKSDSLTTAVTFECETTEWVGKNGSGDTLQETTITTNADALLEVEWSATWQNTGSYTAGEMVAYRILVDGIEVAQMVAVTREREFHHTYLVGAIPVQGGTSTVTVQIKQFDINTFGVPGQSPNPATKVNERELILRAYKR